MSGLVLIHHNGPKYQNSEPDKVPFLESRRIGPEESKPLKAKAGEKLRNAKMKMCVGESAPSW